MGRRENIRRAKDIIAANRNTSISEYENHVAEVSSAYPEFKRITTLLAGTGPRIMAASLGKMLEEDSIESIDAALRKVLSEPPRVNQEGADYVRREFTKERILQRYREAGVI